MTQKHLLAGLGSVVFAALLVSGIDPYDRLTWVMEVAPAEKLTGSTMTGLMVSPLRQA